LPLVGQDLPNFPHRVFNGDAGAALLADGLKSGHSLKKRAPHLVVFQTVSKISREQERIPVPRRCWSFHLGAFLDKIGCALTREGFCRTTFPMKRGRETHEEVTIFWISQEFLTKEK
jgi:hypothetical protein